MYSTEGIDRIKCWDGNKSESDPFVYKLFVNVRLKPNDYQPFCSNPFDVEVTNSFVQEI